MEFSRQEYWSCCHFLLQGNLPDPGIKPRSPALQADALPSEPPGNYIVFVSGIEQSDLILHIYVHACTLGRFSYVFRFATLQTAARQAPLSVGFSRQEYWSALPFPPPGDLPDPGIKPASCVAPASQADSLLLSHLGIP